MGEGKERGGGGTLTTRYSMVYMEKDACPEKNDFLRDSRGVKPGRARGAGVRALDSPGLLDSALRTLTVVVSDVAQGAVDGGEVRFAHVQEVGAHAAHRHFGDVGEGLADGAAEDEHAHLLVEGGDVGVPHEGLGAFVQEVDPVALPGNDLEGHGLVCEGSESR